MRTSPIMNPSVTRTNRSVISARVAVQDVPRELAAALAEAHGYALDSPGVSWHCEFEDREYALRLVVDHEAEPKLRDWDVYLSPPGTSTGPGSLAQTTSAQPQFHDWVKGAAPQGLELSEEDRRYRVTEGDLRPTLKAIVTPDAGSAADRVEKVVLSIFDMICSSADAHLGQCAITPRAEGDTITPHKPPTYDAIWGFTSAIKNASRGEYAAAWNEKAKTFTVRRLAAGDPAGNVPAMSAEALSRTTSNAGIDLPAPPADQMNTALRDAPTSTRSDPTQAKLYVASRASIPARPELWRKLRAEGWPINSTWIDEAGPGETGNMRELWSRIENEIEAASGLLLYAEGADFPLKGALVEVGIALGLDKRVGVFTDVVFETAQYHPFGSWMNHPLVKRCFSLQSAREWALSAVPPTQEVPAPTSDGWHPHKPGDPRPSEIHDTNIIEVRLRSGTVLSAAADWFIWRIDADNPQSEILAWRFAQANYTPGPTVDSSEPPRVFTVKTPTVPLK